MFKRILVAVDDTPVSTRALASSIGLAKALDATLHAVHVLNDAAILPIFDAEGNVPLYVEAMQASQREQGVKILASARKVANRRGVTIKEQLFKSRGGSVADAILQCAHAIRADLIVLGTHGRRGMRRLVMGSDAEGVVREANVPVLLIRSAETAPRPKRAGKKARKGRSKRTPSLAMAIPPGQLAVQ